MLLTNKASFPNKHRLNTLETFRHLPGPSSKYLSQHYIHVCIITLHTRNYLLFDNYTIYNNIAITKHREKEIF